MHLQFSRRLFLWSLFLLTVLLSTSCKRKADPEPPSVIGTWAGQHSFNTAVAPNTTWTSMTLKAGGVLEGNGRTGTYNVAGTVLTATFVYSSIAFSFRCDIKENFTKLEGTWGYGASQTDGGQMLLTKQ